MDDRISMLEAKLERLVRTIENLDHRLEVLEKPPRSHPAPQAEAVRPDLPDGGLTGSGAPSHRFDLVASLSLIGRLLIVLGGGYFLRAITEAGAFSPLVGVGAGLAYALAFVAVADGAAAKDRRLSAVFHGLAAVLIGFPVISEATLRFELFAPGASALLLAVVVAAGLLVAWRRRLRTLAWIVTVGALMTALLLMFGTGQIAPFALVLLGVGTVTAWMGYSLDWFALRWPVAVVVNLVVLALTARAVSPEPTESAAITVAAQVLLLASHLGSTGVRTLVRGRNVVLFEVIQTAAILVVGFGGALWVAQSSGSNVALLGWIWLALGVGSYAVAAMFLDPGRRLGRNVYFYTSLGIVFILAGGTLLWAGPGLVVLWGALALAACALWGRAGRAFLLLHGAAYLAAAGVSAGVFGYGLRTLLAPPMDPWIEPSGAHLVVLVAGALCAWLAGSRTHEPGEWRTLVPRLLIVATVVWTGGGEIMGWVAPALAKDSGASMDPGVLATLRTGILSLSAIAVAVVGRSGRFRDWALLVYPLLILIGIKMIAQDFSVSRPATLFVALALYGAALILAPRLRRVMVSPHGPEGNAK
jgi:hypothetical protein